jgi:hypothetical protein
LEIFVEDWLTKALEIFPELGEEIQRTEGGPIGLWSNLYFALEKAYREQPVNESLIARIYDYAAWCLRQPDTRDVESNLPNAVAGGFIESLPLDARVSDDLHRWLSLETFEGCKALFRHHLSEEQYQELHRHFLSRREQYSGPTRI